MVLPGGGDGLGLSSGQLDIERATVVAGVGRGPGGGDVGGQRQSDRTIGPRKPEEDRGRRGGIRIGGGAAGEVAFQLGQQAFFFVRPKGQRNG